jgi:hypoxanthine phosphoribosyltransferase
VLITTEDLRDGVRRLAAELSETYEDGVLLVAVLKGSVLFLADLVRALSIVPEVDFLAISSYGEGSDRVRIVKDVDADISGRHVVLVEDIVDTGLTLTYVLGELGRRNPSSLEVCTLLDKATRRIVPLNVRFTGFEVGDDFVLGYGLDYAGYYRNLDLVVVGDMEELRDVPQAYVEELYSNPRDEPDGYVTDPDAR